MTNTIARALGAQKGPQALQPTPIQTAAGVTRRFAITAAAVLAFAASAEATPINQVVLSANSATMVSGYSSDFPGTGMLNGLINQNGLQQRLVAGCTGMTYCNQTGLQYTSGVTGWDAYFAANPTHTTEMGSPGSYFEWWSYSNTSSASIKFDFGTEVWLSGIAIWNEDAVGVSTFGLRDGSGNTLLSGQSLTNNPSWPQALPYSADLFTFGAVQTRYLTLDMTVCNYQNATFGYRCSLGEVAFRQELVWPPPASPSEAPEPASVVLLGTGLAGAVWAARKGRRGVYGLECFTAGRDQKRTEDQ